ncbi:hypothetical protein TRICI_001281 [Trichomonascus ciferrii]|uniref:Uncharacterized protein n=1 Tax=Trichomonascus ciferrii TaxID=44093 RepID=A0A642VCI1_9ASCO|nr:hypothetical protein TRICI_001281 [Trichomonascus ciferrii]
MGFFDPHSGAAASTFLVLYTLLCGGAIFTVVRKGWKSTYTLLLFFCMIRMGAQLCAVAFASLGYEHYEWLIAYLVLGAEGYFTLILSSFYFQAYAEYITFGRSDLKPTKDQLEREYSTPRERRYARFTSPSAIFHWLMIPANAIIIAGGTQLSGVVPGDPDYESKYKTSKGMRSTGQALFLFLVAVSGATNLWLIFKKRVRIYMVYATLIAWVPLFARGVFGLLSCFLDSLNYFDISNYTADGISTKFIVCEYVLGATMEFIGAALLLSTYFIKNPYKRSLSHYTDIEFTGTAKNESSTNSKSLN